MTLIQTLSCVLAILALAGSSAHAAEPKYTSDAGTIDLESAGGRRVYHLATKDTAIAARLDGPERYAVLVRAKSRDGAAYSVVLDGRKIADGSLNGPDRKKQAGPERSVAVLVPAGAHGLEIKATRGEFYARVAGENEDDGLPPVISLLALPPIDQLPTTLQPPQAAPAKGSGPAFAAVRGPVPGADAPKPDPAPHRMAPFQFIADLGYGRAVESGVPTQGFAAAEVGLEIRPVEYFLIGVDVGKQVYDRTYRTTYPGKGGGGLLTPNVNEQFYEGRVLLGYDVLRWLQPDDSVAHLTPFLEIRPARYDNEIAPQTLLGLGGGVRAMVKLGGSLRLEAEFAYSANMLPTVSKTSSDKVASLLQSGVVTNSLREYFGFTYAISSALRAGLGYRGERLGQTHATRYGDGLGLHVDVDL